MGFIFLRYWSGAHLGAAGDDDAQERYLYRLFGGGFGVEVGGVDGNFLCGGGDLLDLAYSVGGTRGGTRSIGDMASQVGAMEFVSGGHTRSLYYLVIGWK